jgi:hypothetical protein
VVIPDKMSYVVFTAGKVVVKADDIVAIVE